LTPTPSLFYATAVVESLRWDCSAVVRKVCAVMRAPLVKVTVAAVFIDPKVLLQSVIKVHRTQRKANFLKAVNRNATGR